MEEERNYDSSLTHMSVLLLIAAIFCLIHMVVNFFEKDYVFAILHGLYGIANLINVYLLKKQNEIPKQQTYLLRNIALLLILAACLIMIEMGALIIKEYNMLNILGILYIGLGVVMGIIAIVFMLYLRKINQYEMNKEGKI